MGQKRMIRVNEQVHRELGRLFQIHVCPDAHALVTVTDVKVAEDLRDATVYVSVYGDDVRKAAVTALLEKRRAVLQHELSRRVILKFTPRLHFKLDDTAARADRIMSILEELHLDDGSPSNTASEKSEVAPAQEDATSSPANGQESHA